MATEVVLKLTGDATGLKKALDTVDRELAQVVQQTDRAQAALGQGLGKATEQATKKANQFTNAQRNMLFAGRQGRANLQNLGFQLQDVAVQLEMGTDASRVFAQQGSQILGILGPWGALTGAVVAGMVALVPLLSSGAAEMSAYAKAMEEGVEANQKLEDQLRELTTGEGPALARMTDELAEAMGRLADAQQAVADAEASGEAESLVFLDQKVTLREQEVEELEKVRDRHIELIEQIKKEKEQQDQLSAIEKLREKNISDIRLQFDQVLARIDSAITKTRDWAGEMYRVAQANVALGANGLDGGYQRQLDSQAYGAGQQAQRELLQNGYVLPEDKPKGGGGKSPAEKQTEEMIKLIASVEAAVDAYKGLYDINEQMADIWANGIQQGIAGFTDALFDADKSFEDFAKNMLINIGKIITQTIIMNALLSAFGGTPGIPQGQVQTALQGIAGIKPYAKGGVVNGPTLFPMSGGQTGLMGEAGPEAIMPLARGSDGSLGVSGPSIRINNYSGQEVQVTRSDDEVIEIAVGRARQASAQDFADSMSSGHGTYAKALEGSYKTPRKAF